MSELILLHNPRCSKSRAALRLLEARGLQPQVVRYLETPPSAAELKAILAKLGIPARQLLRTGRTNTRPSAWMSPVLAKRPSSRQWPGIRS